MKKSELEFVEALRKVGLSRSLCESVNDIRKAVFEEASREESLSFEEKIDEYSETHDRSLFDHVGNFSEGYARVKLNGKWNFIDKDGNLLWKGDEWFDYVGLFLSEGYAEVKLDEKGWNLIDKDGNLLWKGDEWFDYVCYFWEGYARIKLNGKYNFIDKEGNLLWEGEKWFDDADDFDEGYAEVELDGKRYKIDKEGDLHEENLYEEE